MKNKWNWIIGPLVIIVLWFWVAKFVFMESILLPGPIKTLSYLVGLVLGGDILGDFFATLFRTIIVFFIAFVVGVPLGLALGLREPFYRSVEFLIDFFRSTPATAIFPLFLLFFGVSDFSKILAASFGAVLIVLFHSAYGVMHSKKSRVLAAKLMGASKTQVFKWIVFWEVLPDIFVGLRSAVSVSLVIIVVLEMFIGTTVGIGKRIVDAQIVYNTPEMYSVIILAGILGYVLNYALLLIERKVVHWK